MAGSGKKKLGRKMMVGPPGRAGMNGMAGMVGLGKKEDIGGISQHPGTTPEKGG